MQDSWIRHALQAEMATTRMTRECLRFSVTAFPGFTLHILIINACKADLAITTASPSLSVTSRLNPLCVLVVCPQPLMRAIGRSSTRYAC